MLTDDELKAKLDASPGERVTKEQIEDRIADIAFMRLGEHLLSSGVTATLCTLTLDNGFSVRGESACVDPKNYDREIGERFAYDDAFRKLWPFFGFLLAEQRFTRQNPKEE